MSGPNLRFCYSAAVLAVALLWGTPGRTQQVQVNDVARTVALCTACHRDKFNPTARNPHALLDNADWQQRTGLVLGCFNCHGDVTMHVRAGGGRGSVFAFREEPPAAQSETCLGCHRDTHPGFDRSPHALAGLSCTNCHSQHHAAGADALLRAADTPSNGAGSRSGTGVCFDCHNEIRSDFAFNERHRLREGILECTSCHDPHAPVSRSLLGGFKQQQCLDCHTDKGGPFIFEHPASRVEGCTACHSPHGSPNRHMLTHQRVGELCFTCHAAVPQFHSGFSPVGAPRFGLETQCTNCHSTIHGSNFDPFFLK
jgi:DmsE family decaheme c-type cytochrome